jgi:hypothetical protein
VKAFSPFVTRNLNQVSAAKCEEDKKKSTLVINGISLIYVARSWFIVYRKAPKQEQNYLTDLNYSLCKRIYLMG